MFTKLSFGTFDLKKIKKKEKGKPSQLPLKLDMINA